MKKQVYWLLIVIAAALLCASETSAALDKPGILRDLLTFSDINLKTRSAELSKQQPDTTRLLTLDLLFYRWASEKYEMDPGIRRLDQIVGTLCSDNSDAVVGWAASVLGRPEWVSGAPTPASDDEQIKLLSDARNALRQALDIAARSPTRSTDALKTCINALDTLGLKLSYAFVTVRLAEQQLYSSHRYREAEANYERARPIFTAYGLRANVARILDDLGYLHTKVGRYDAAKDSYNASAQEWQMIERGDLAGKQFVNAGSSLAADGKLDLALSTMQHGLSVSRVYSGDAKNAVTHTQLLLQVASYCSNRGLYVEARDLLLEADETAQRTNEPLLHAVVLRDAAKVWTALGVEPRIRECTSRREKILTTLIECGVSAASELSDPLLTSSERTKLLADAEQGAEACSALGKYEQGVDILKQVVDKYDALHRDEDRVRALSKLAFQYDGLNNTQLALVTRSQAAELAKRIGKRALVLEILREIERTAREAGDRQTALEALRESVDMIQESEDVLALAEALEARGTLLDSMGQPTEAIRDLDRAAATYAAELGEPWSQARILIKLANVQANAGQVTDAISSLSTAIRRIEEWADTEGIDVYAEVEHADMSFSLYFHLIGLQISEGQKTEALASLRKARRHTWFTRLRTIMTASDDPTAREVLAELDKTSGDSPTEPHVLPGGARLVARGWPEVIGQAAAFSRLARRGLNTDGVGPIDASDIFRVKDRLPGGLMIVEYAISDKGVFALMAKSETASCWELPASGSRIIETVGTLRKAMAELEKQIASGIPVPPIKDWRAQSLLPVLDPLYSLSGMLLDPLRGELSKAKTIAFALPDELTGVPFQALPQDKRGKISFLIQDCAVSYVTPGLLEALTRTTRSPITGKKGRVAIFADSSGRYPGATAEANHIRTLYGQNSKLYTANNANAERFVASAAWSNIIHVATHHQLDPNPAHFSLVLSTAKGGTVRSSDLMRISNPHLELIVLSACETISTSDIGFAGAPNTAEIFALVGFPSVIGGLWEVSDNAARQLMESFYTNLASTGHKGTALQRAQKSMVESKDGKYAHPFYWASFALYGDPE